jgi:hypothetical protein
MKKWLIGIAWWLDIGLFTANLVKHGFEINLFGMATAIASVVLLFPYVWWKVFPFDK